MVDRGVGLIGISSFVGEQVARELGLRGIAAHGFSRQGGGNTRSLFQDEPAAVIEDWICVAPIWVVAEHFKLLEAYGIRRLVAISSTSRFTKRNSASAEDRELAARLSRGEEEVLAWAETGDKSVVILQPTMIYGYGRDQNIAAIAAFINRFGFFPLFGRGSGLRRPVHVDDVAVACVAALGLPDGTRRTYILSGREELTYRDMVERIFAALGREPRFIRCPLILFSLAVRLANLLPRFRGLTTEMAVRMNNDQVFDHAEATKDLGFSPRPFELRPCDCLADRSEH